MFTVVKLTVVAILLAVSGASAQFDYRDALYKTLLFFEAQRSGRLPGDQRANWRGDSGTSDGQDVGRDLTGGYYDAGDNVKFGFPMAYTVTMLSWGVAEYSAQLAGAGQLQYALAAVKWGTDYFMKAHTSQYEFYGQVGQGQADHNCWMRPEDPQYRQAFKIDSSHPGSDLAGEVAAAFAAASVAFKNYNPSYSTQLLGHAKQMFDFADRFRGTYTGSIPSGGFYSSNGYTDELLWAAAWLHRASGDDNYLKYAVDNVHRHAGLTANSCTNWDNKYGALQVLLGKYQIMGQGQQFSNVLGQYKNQADSYMCSLLGKNPNSKLNTPKTRGGLIYCDFWSPNQYVGAAALTMSVYADALKSKGQNLQCGGSTVSPDSMLDFVRNQINYVLGQNPIGRSYLVGSGYYPKRIHHRASSLPTVRSRPNAIGCGEGWQFYGSQNDNYNVLVGAIVGGPDANDNFNDDRTNYMTNEPITYLNAPFVGALARISGGYVSSSPTPSPPPRKKGRHPPGEGGHRWVPPKAGSPPFQKREVALKTVLASTYKSNGKSYSKYNVIITNATKRKVYDILMRVRRFRAIRVDGAIMSKKNTRCFVPKSYVTFKPKQTFIFSYTQLAGGKLMDLKIINYIAVKN